jgi:cation-transporting P-type ATPase 13A2
MPDVNFQNIICQATTVPYPYSYTSTFQTNGGTTPVPSSTSGIRPSSAIKMSAMASALPQNGVELDEDLRELKMFDYRYNRYILNPRTGLWTMVK